MVTTLVHAGDLVDTRWQDVFAAVPRHVLVPYYYRPDNYQKVDGTTARDYDTWLRKVYSDETLITQKTSHTVTSSGTMPGLIALMLAALDIHDEHRVLQIGTGTGYTAALLCQRLGPNNVTTVDLDTELVNTARARLSTLGYHPTVVAGNGTEGYPPHAPYDRILATCSLTHVPTAWLAQTRPDSRIVAPMAKGLFVLDVHSNEEASGRFLPTGGYFMPLRDTTNNARPHGQEPPTRNGDTRPTTLGPRETFYQQHVRFLLTVVLPEVSVGQHGPSLDDLIIQDGRGSWARLDRSPDGAFIVPESGQRQLWAEVENVHQQWHLWNQPHRDRFGLSVTPARQWIWLDDPIGEHTWEISAAAFAT
jgi:protein-L-isoaspartate O-methyltransferase